LSLASLANPVLCNALAYWSFIFSEAPYNPAGKVFIFSLDAQASSFHRVKENSVTYLNKDQVSFIIIYDNN
jgi:hypothetical protein